MLIEIHARYVFIIASLFLMIEKIILAITHSDDYTDYLYQTACLTNSRIVPMLNPTASELYKATGDNTIVYRCDGRYKDPQMIAPSVFAHSINRTITVLTHYYLREDGSIDTTEAGIAREMIEKALLEVLESPQNLREVYRGYFTGLWNNRNEIYAKPQLFYANCGISNKFVKSVPLGVMLKTLEENPGLFMNPDNGQMLIDFQFVENQETDKWEWNLEWWYPDCRYLTTEIVDWMSEKIKTKDLLAYEIEKTCRKYNKGQGRSPLNIFNVIDNLSITR